MPSIKVSVKTPLGISSEQLFKEILETANWESFRGYGPLPGIHRAEFVSKTADVVGSKIKVTNSDGSTHIETITNWQEPHSIEMCLNEFSPPLHFLATHFTEQWKIGEASVLRSMTLHAKSILAIPILWIISLFMKQALKSHTTEISSP